MVLKAFDGAIAAKAFNNDDQCQHSLNLVVEKAILARNQSDNHIKPPVKALGLLTRNFDAP